MLRLPLSLLRRPAADRRLLAEAMLDLLLARLLVRLVPFKRLIRLFERTPKQPELIGERRGQVRYDVARAIYLAAELLPTEVVCLPRAIAAQAMLRRRGIGASLYYGAAVLPQTGLTGHAWLQDGEHWVVGNQEAQGYRVLARYPSGPESWGQLDR